MSDGAPYWLYISALVERGNMFLNLWSPTSCKWDCLVTSHGLCVKALCGTLPGLHHHFQEADGHPRHERQGTAPPSQYR